MAVSRSPDDPRDREAHLLGDSLLNSLVGDKTEEDNVFTAATTGGHNYAVTVGQPRQQNGPIYVTRDLKGQPNRPQMNHHQGGGPPWSLNQYYYQNRNGVPPTHIAANITNNYSSNRQINFCPPPPDGAAAPVSYDNCSRRSSGAAGTGEYANFGAVGNFTGDPQNWNSFYTPFGPMQVAAQQQQQCHPAACYVWPPGVEEIPPPVASLPPQPNIVLANSQASASPSLPPKIETGGGLAIKIQSYRDVVTKPPIIGAEPDELGVKLRKNVMKATKAQSCVIRKNSTTNAAAGFPILPPVAAKIQLRTQSSSDSLSECSSQQGFVHVPKSKENSDDSESEKSAVLGNKLTNLYRQNNSADFGPKLSSADCTVIEQNAFKKNATTATESQDFQKITRKKSKTALSTGGGGFPVPLTSADTENSAPAAPQQPKSAATGIRTADKTVTKLTIKVNKTASVLDNSSEKENLGTSNGRFSVLESPTDSSAASNKKFGANYSAPAANPAATNEQHQQKLNNDEKNNLFYPDFIGSKMITSIRKGLYIKNDLSPGSKIDGEFDDLENQQNNPNFSVDYIDNDESSVNNDQISIDGDNFEVDKAPSIGKKHKGKNSSSAKYEAQLAAPPGGIAVLTKSQQKPISGGAGGKKAGKSHQNDLKRKRKQNSRLVDSFAYGMSACTYYVQSTLFWFVSLIADIVNQLLDIFLHCSKRFYNKIATVFLGAFLDVQEYARKSWLTVRQKEWSFIFWWRNRKKYDDAGFGLEHNIPLPNTGEEAMKRLLMCRGQDAYSILGVKPDCTDDELKHYYRRQAVLVHPDKNPSYGAEEAFKILAAAFEVIGTPEHRREYDLENFHRSKAMKDLEEMLNRLREKMEEVRSTMHCDCGDKHRRFLTDRELSSARYCRRCKTHHAAQNGDIWAESQWFGFLWYYFACMEGAVYDITEWAGCQKNNLKHIRPNEHFVKYRLTTGRNMRKPQQNSMDGKGLSDADAEAIFNRLLDENFSGLGGSRSAAGGDDFCSPSASQNVGGGDLSDFSMHSRFRPPSCSNDSGRPRRGGRRRKGGRVL